MLPKVQETVDFVTEIRFIDLELIGVVTAFQNTAGETVVQIQRGEAPGHGIRLDLFDSPCIVIPEEVDTCFAILHPDNIRC